MSEVTSTENSPNDTARARDAQSPFAAVPVEMIVSVGKARPRISELLSLGEAAVLTLDTRVDDPVDLYVGDRLVARGELEELEGDDAGKLAVRITEVVQSASTAG